MSLDAKTLQSLVKKYPVLAGCIIVGPGLAITIYTRSDMSSTLAAELDQRSAEGKRYHANLLNAVQLNEELQTVMDANRVVKEHAINPADLAKNLQYFYRIEAESGVKYTDLRPIGSANPKRSGSVYIPVNYAITVTGDFLNIITFLRNLEQGAHFYRLNGLVASGKDSSATLNLNVDLLGQP